MKDYINKNENENWVLSIEGDEAGKIVLKTKDTKLNSDIVIDANFDKLARLEDGKIPSEYLPSYVDDVLEFNTVDDFPEEGEAGKIYVSLTDNLTYRWSGSSYVEISKSLALGETSATAYPGNLGKANADNLTTKVSKTGDTMTGNLSIKNRNDVSILVGVSGDGKAKGIWDNNTNKWVMYTDENSASHFAGNATSATKASKDANGNVISSTYALKSEIPELADWAKANDKPTYTKSEIGLGNVGNFKAVSTVASQGLTNTEKTNARNNIGAGTSSFSGNYGDLNGAPEVMPNPHKLIINGAEYDGSEEVTVTVTGGGITGDFEEKSNKVNTINTSSTTTQYPSAKAVYDALSGKQDSGNYALKNEIPTVPTDVSAFNNDAGYLTEHQSLDGYALASALGDQVVFTLIGTTLTITRK